ncbi:MAG: hypothetical protein ABSB58_12020 [Gemmatimonadales bacterium]|jgi:hypothetical protein
MALPARDHRISLADAAVLTKRHRDAKVSEVKAGAFHKDQVLQMLNQAGCVALRIYFGREAGGAPTLVLTGVDASDNDLTKGIILEQSWPCPPACGSDNALNS